MVSDFALPYVSAQSAFSEQGKSPGCIGWQPPGIHFVLKATIGPPSREWRPVARRYSVHGHFKPRYLNVVSRKSLNDLISGDPTKTSLPSSTQQNPSSTEHLIKMPLSFVNASTACAHSKCQTSRPKCFLLHAIKSGFGHVGLRSPARGGFWFSMSSAPAKSAEQF